MIRLAPRLRFKLLANVIEETLRLVPARGAAVARARAGRRTRRSREAIL